MRKIFSFVMFLSLMCDVFGDEVKSVTEGESVSLNTDVQTQSGDLILWGFGEKNTLIAKLDKDDNKPPYYEGRFSDRLWLDDQTGSLTITNIRITDSGLYQLKISSNSKQTLYKTFSVSVSEESQFPGEIVGIVVHVLMVFLAVGLILYRYRIIKLKNQIDTSMTPGGIVVTVVRVLLVFLVVGVILYFYMIIIPKNQIDASLTPNEIAVIVVDVLMVFLGVGLVLYRYMIIIPKYQSGTSLGPAVIVGIVIHVVLLFPAAVGVILFCYVTIILLNQIEESQSPDEIAVTVGRVLLLFPAAVGLILSCYRTFRLKNQIENNPEEDLKTRMLESDCEIEEENKLKSVTVEIA